MNKKYKALLIAIIAIWLGAVSSYEVKRYESTKKQIVSLVSFNPGASAKQNTEDKKQNSAEQKAEKKAATVTEEATVSATESKSVFYISGDESTSAEITQAVSGLIQQTTQDAKTTTAVEKLTAEEKEMNKTVLEKINGAVKDVKENNDSFTITEKRNVSLILKECSVEGLRPAVESLMQSYAGESETVYNYVNGVSTDSIGNNISVQDVLPPKYSSFAAAIYNIYKSDMESVKNGTKCSFTVIGETVDINGVPFNHASTVGYIDFSKLDLTPFTLTGLKAEYKQSDFSTIIDSKGRIVSVNTHIPVDIEITADYGAEVSVKITGVIEYGYRFGY